MKEKTTIIIPSHDRHHLLLRAIDYYSELDFLVLIVDSSEVFLNVKLPGNITYLHLLSPILASHQIRAILRREIRVGLSNKSYRFPADRGDPEI